MIPVLGHLELTRRLGLFAQEFTSPDIPIRSVVKALGHLVRNVLDEFPHEVRCAPAEVEVAVVAQGPDRLEVADVLDEIVAVGLRRGALDMSLGVLETENEVDVGVIQQRLKRLGDLLGSGLVLAVDQPDLTSRLGRCCVQDALAVGRKSPCFLLGRGQVGHALPCGQADTRQIRVRQDQLLDALTEVVGRHGIVELGRQPILAFRAVYAVLTRDEDVPGDHVDVHVAVLGVPHHLPPKRNLLVHGHFQRLRDALDIIQGHFLIAGHANHGREGMKIPQGQVVVTEASQVIDIRLPEVHVPHHQYVLVAGNHRCGCCKWASARPADS